ncbi:Co2+/Mg2+ efflux protein ApaG [Aquirufa sp. ROCK2-A2]
MPESIYNGFFVSVKTTQILDYEIQRPYQFYFSYQITIKNLSEQPAQLISRFWKIVDGAGNTENVNGLGVVGLQPVIEPGMSFTYSSGCPLISNFGQMSGHYNFLNLDTKSSFKVIIPPFELIPTFALN